MGMDVGLELDAPAHRVSDGAAPVGGGIQTAQHIADLNLAGGAESGKQTREDVPQKLQEKAQKW